MIAETGKRISTLLQEKKCTAGYGESLRIYESANGPDVYFGKLNVFIASF